MKGRDKEKEENKNVKKKRGNYRPGPPASLISSLTCTLTVHVYKISSARHGYIRQSLEGLCQPLCVNSWRKLCSKIVYFHCH